MILHVTIETDWQACIELDDYAPPSFLQEGFIHACHSQQLQGVLQRYFAGRTDLLLLHVEEEKLTCQLKQERATGSELFPHIYGRINKEAISKIEKLIIP